MKQRIILSLVFILAASTLGAGFAIVSIRNTTKTLTDLVSLHQIEDMRQHLVISIQTVQSDLYTIHTNLGESLDRIASNVAQLEQAAQRCSGCHHEPEAAQQIENLQSLVDGYENALSYYITASSNRKQIDKLKFDASAIGMNLLLKTQGMSARAGRKLEARTRDAYTLIKRAWLLVAAGMVITFILAVVVALRLAASVTRPIEILVNATRKLARGDLGHTIEYQDETEFGELADHFNAMSRSLKTSYAKLEQEIADRVQVEETLRTNEMRFRVLFEQAAAGVAQMHTASGTLIKLNRRFCEILGYEEEELVGRTFQSITYPDDLETNLDSMRRLLSGEIRDFSMEKRYIRKDGVVIWASLSVSAMWMPGEEPQYNIGVVLDITERKRIEAELIESHARYRQLFETAPVSTLEVDYSGIMAMLKAQKDRGVDIKKHLENDIRTLSDLTSRVTIRSANQSAIRLFGARDKSELAGSLEKIMLPEGLEAFRRQLMAMMAGETSFETETIRGTLDGRRIEIIQHVQVIGDPGCMDRVLISHTDITALKRAKHSLRRSSDFIATVMNSIDPAIVIIDAQHNSVIGCNRSFLGDAALSEADVKGMPRQRIVCSSYALTGRECAFLETMRTGNHAICEHIRVDHTGAVRNIEIRTFPIKDDDNKITQVIHLAQDITLRRQAEEARVKEQELKRISAERQVAETRLRMLQAQIEPHFLFNTLAHIITLIPKEPATAVEMLQHFTETLRVSLLRTRQGTSTLGQETDLLRDFLSIYRMRMGHRLRFTIDVPAELLDLPLPPLLLQPLVENAVIHGIERSITGGDVAIRAERAVNNMVRLKVSDTGRGMSDFTSNGGIGLANVRERLEALYGGKARLILSENSPCGLNAVIEVPCENARINS